MGKFSEEALERKEKQIAADKKRREEAANKKFIRRLPMQDGRNIFRFKETNTDGDYPWEEMGIHYNCGPESDKQFRCLRDEANEKREGYKPPSACPQCKENNEGFKSDNKRKKTTALKRRRNQRAFFEGICLTPLAKYFDKGEIPKPKKCFGNFAWAEDDERYRECKKCSTKTAWGKICSYGIGYISFGPTLSEPLIHQAKKIFKSLGHNPFSLKEGHNFEFTKTGEGLKTSYSGIGFDFESFPLPKVVVKYIKGNELNWSEIYPKLSVEEMESEMAGVELEEEDDVSDDEMEEELDSMEEVEDDDEEEEGEEDDEEVEDDDDEEDEEDDEEVEDEEEDEEEEDEEVEDEEVEDEGVEDEEDGEEGEEEREDDQEEGDNEVEEGEEEEDEKFYEEIEKELEELDDEDSKELSSELKSKKKNKKNVKLKKLK